MKRLAIWTAIVALLACPAFAQDASKDTKVDVTGRWDSTVESPQGAISSVATYKQDGETLTGSHVGQLGELPLKGTVKGNAITYSLTVDMQGQTFTITYSGTVEGDVIKGTADFGGMGTGNWTAKRKPA